MVSSANRSRLEEAFKKPAQVQAHPIYTPAPARGPAKSLFLVATRSGPGAFTLAVENLDGAILSARSSDVQLKVLYDRAYEAQTEVCYLVVKCAPFQWPANAVDVVGIGSAVCDRCDALREQATVWAKDAYERDTIRMLRIGGAGVVYQTTMNRSVTELTLQQKRDLSAGGCTIVLRTFDLTATTQAMQLLLFSSANELVLRSEPQCSNFVTGPCAHYAPIIPSGLFRTRKVLIVAPKGPVGVVDLAVMAFPRMGDAARVARVTALFAQNRRVGATIRAFLQSTAVRNALGVAAPLFSVMNR